MITSVAVIGACLALAGGLLLVLAGVGIVRLPDAYMRMHAASKASALGASCILLAVGLLSLDSGVMVRALVTAGFMLVTTPLAANLLGRAARRSGVPFEPETLRYGSSLPLRELPASSSR